jgi:hypothetical protein
MDPTNWRYRGRRTPQQERDFRSAQRRRIERRWERVREARAGERVRETRVVEVTIRDSHRPMTTIRMETQERERGWGRFAVWQQGARIGARRFGRSGIAELLARWLE